MLNFRFIHLFCILTRLYFLGMLDSNDSAVDTGMGGRSKCLVESHVF